MKVLVALAVMCMSAAVQAELVRQPTSVGTSIDVGQIVKGRLVGDSHSDTVSGDGQFLTRTGVYLSESATFNEKLTFQLTLGGLFFYALPENLRKPEYRFFQFGNGVGQAQAAYAFGAPEKPAAKLQFGLFPIKYNPDSKNLGEYLYRSGTYPGLIYTGGWSYLNSASYLAQGLRFTWNALGGKLIHDFTLTMERDLQPNHDLSPGYSLTWKPMPAFEMGAGAVWTNGISLRSEIATPEVDQNAFVVSTGIPLNYGSVGKQDMESPGYSLNDPAVVQAYVPDSANPGNFIPNPLLGQPVDPVNRAGVVYVARDVFAVPDSIPVDPNDPFGPQVANPVMGQAVPGKPGFTFVSESEIFNVNGTPRSDLDFYTFRGFKVMARVSLDLGLLMGMETGAFKFYGEWALLGVQNQPFYYEKKSERMPIMVGVNIPTFKLLDLLSVEAEYLKSRFRNNQNVVFRKKWPLPLTNEDEDPAIYDGPELKKDDVKWSVYARKQITRGFSIHAQAARDNQRQIGWDYGPTLMDFPATELSGDWYYILRVEFGI